MAEKKANDKKRNWGLICYPESLPTDWEKLLQDTGLQCAISPLHDKDLEPTGEVKKAHYHVILTYSGPTSFNCVNKICESLNCPIPKPLEQIRGYYRYFTHKDNPEKYQYDEKEIKTINGFNITDFVELTKSEVANIKKKLQRLILEMAFTEYSDFMDYLLEDDIVDNYDVACNNTYFFDRYISSKRHKAKNGKLALLNTDTGEVITI